MQLCCESHMNVTVCLVNCNSEPCQKAARLAKAFGQHVWSVVHVFPCCLPLVMLTTCLAGGRDAFKSATRLHPPGRRRGLSQRRGLAHVLGQLGGRRAVSAARRRRSPAPALGRPAALRHRDVQPRPSGGESPGRGFGVLGRGEGAGLPAFL